MNNKHNPENKECHMFRAVHPACDGSNEVCNDCTCPEPKQEKCKCACHENVLRKPYEHDTTCCDEMNGFIPPERKDFVEGKIAELYECTGYRCGHETSETHFLISEDEIRQSLIEAYAQGARDMLSRAKEAVKGVCPDMPDEIRPYVDEIMGYDDYTTGVTHAKSKALSALEALTPPK